MLSSIHFNHPRKYRWFVLLTIMLLKTLGGVSGSHLGYQVGPVHMINISATLVRLVQQITKGKPLREEKTSRYPTYSSSRICLVCSCVWRIVCCNAYYDYLSNSICLLWHSCTWMVEQSKCINNF